MLLALDVTSSTCTVVLFDPGREAVLAEKVWRSRRRQTEETLPAVVEVLAQAGAVMDDVGMLAVTTGPGSFTGVRIGISVVKGIALGLREAPRLIGLPVLSVTAARFVPLAAPGADVWAVLQAGRGRFNWAAAPADDPLWLPAASEHCTGQAEALVAALQAAGRPVWLVGELSSGLRQDLEGLAHVRCIDPAAKFDLPEDYKSTSQFLKRRGSRAGRLDRDPGGGVGPAGDAPPARRLSGMYCAFAATLFASTSVGKNQWDAGAGRRQAAP